MGTTYSKVPGDVKTGVFFLLLLFFEVFVCLLLFLGESLVAQASLDPPASAF